MITEMRIYDATPGNLGALLARFETITLDIWKRIGIRPIGFWTTMIGNSNNRLIYMLQWDSLAQRDQLWTRFISDPEWIEKKLETERNGPLLTNVQNEILVRTAFSREQRDVPAVG